MPKKQHLPSVSDKEQRMYEHIKESELEAGRSTKRAKAIAAATVVKHHNEEKHAPSEVEAGHLGPSGKLATKPVLLEGPVLGGRRHGRDPPALPGAQGRRLAAGDGA